MDVEILSRLQFAGTIMFHYLFPPLSIGLGLQLFLCELAYFRTRNLSWEAAARFWTRAFAVNLAMGVATGIVMEFEFGTNWAADSRFLGDVFGSALAEEGIFAFFLESGFLAVLMFGWDRVGPRMHLIGALVMDAFFVASVCSFYLLKKRHEDVAKRCLCIALPSALVFSLLVGATRHDSAQKLVETQRARLAAMEAHFHSSDEPTGLTLFGWPDAKNETVHFGLKLPYLLSLMVFNDPTKPVPAMDQIPVDERPPVWLPFQTFHLMVGMGTCMIGVAAFACLSWRTSNDADHCRDRNSVRAQLHSHYLLDLSRKCETRPHSY